MDAHYNIPIFYVMKNIITEDVMDKRDMFQAMFLKVDEFSWLDMV